MIVVSARITVQIGQIMLLQEIVPDNEELAIIIIRGSYLAGKTTFLESISEIIHDDVEIIDPKYPQYAIVTKAGLVRLGNDGLLVLLAPPGGVRIRDAIEDFVSAIIGHIILCNSSLPETFREAKALLNGVRAEYSEPFLPVATHQDSPDAWSIEDLRIVLRLEQTPTEILPCVTTERDNVKQVLMAFLRTVPDSNIVNQIKAKIWTM